MQLHWGSFIRSIDWRHWQGYNRPFFSTVLGSLCHLKYSTIRPLHTRPLQPAAVTNFQPSFSVDSIPPFKWPFRISGQPCICTRGYGFRRCCSTQTPPKESPLSNLVSDSRYSHSGYCPAPWSLRQLSHNAAYVDQD